MTAGNSTTITVAFEATADVIPATQWAEMQQHTNTSPLKGEA